MAINTISLDKVVDPGVKKHFVDGYKQLDPMVEKIFKVDTQESETDEYQNYTGLSQVSKVSQGGTFQEDTPIKAFGSTFKATKYGKLVPVTYETTKYAKVKEIWDASSMLGKAMARHIQKSGAGMFNNGYNTSYTCLTDGKPLFSVSHTRADGGTAQSNASATGIVFSEANLEVALLALEFQKDDRGELIDTFASTLLVPTDLRRSALTVLKSEKKSGTADNDVNPYGIQEFYGTMKVMIWPYLSSNAGGSATAWYLLDEASHKLTWQWADKPQIDRNTEIGFKQHETYYRGFYMADLGWKDWRGVWGSKGDGQAYSS